MTQPPLKCSYCDRDAVMRDSSDREHRACWDHMDMIPGVPLLLLLDGSDPLPPKPARLR